jgi:hypothetical protein
LKRDKHVEWEWGLVLLGYAVQRQVNVEQDLAFALVLTVSLHMVLVVMESELFEPQAHLSR